MRKDLSFAEETRREKLRDGFTAPLVAACLICFLQVLFGELRSHLLASLPESGLGAFLLRLLIPMILSGLSVFLPFWIYNRLIGERLKPLFTKQRLWVSPAVFFAGIAAVCGFGMLFRWLSMLLTSSMEASGFVFLRQIPPTDSPVLFVLLSALIPAVFYELAFRGIMTEQIRKWSPAAAVILSSIVNSFCYLSLDIMPHALVCGLILGWLYLRTESILLTFCASAVTNGVLAGLWLTDTLSPAVAAVGGVVGIAGLVVCLLLCKNSGTQKPSFTRKEVLRGVFSSFALYAFLVITFLGLMFYHIDKPEPDDASEAGQTAVFDSPDKYGALFSL